MYHPTTRVLTILELLQTYGRLSGAELATRLEVDRRTVRRYVAQLQELGIPVEAERGRHGGYALRPGFRLPPLMLREGEARAIVLSLLAGRAAGLPVAVHDQAAALAKLQRVLPVPLQGELAELAQLLDFGPPQAADQDRELVALLLQAATQHHQVRLLYHAPEHDTWRLVDPYGIVRQADRWYLAGWCHLRSAQRVFRLDRIGAATLEPTPFERPSDVTAAALVQQHLTAPDGGWPVRVVLHMAPDELAGRLPVLGAELTPCAAGVVLTAQVLRLDWLAHRLLGLDCHFTIEAPPELRAALTALGERAMALAQA